MERKVIEGAFSVCKLSNIGQARMEDDLRYNRLPVYPLMHNKGNPDYKTESWKVRKPVVCLYLQNKELIPI